MMMTLSLIARAKRSGERGFSLVELLVTMVLTAIVGTMIVSLLSMTQKTSNEVVTTAMSSQDAQTLIARIENDVRNSVALDVKQTSDGATALIMQVRGTLESETDDETTQRCVGVVFNPSGKTIHYSSVKGTANANLIKSIATAGTWNKSAWQTLGTGLVPRAASDPAYVKLSVAGVGVDVEFSIQPDDQRVTPVRLSTSVAALWPGNPKGNCFA